ncbi:response regulator [Paenibacillus sp. NPDC056579]|uniref:response regulator transcription factor n=1 Tax=Paenibacillus sp. NPDC056579 TaxID=3345871 RepID=UPI0036C141E5
MIKVLIVDDFQIDRDNLVQMLEKSPAFSHVTVTGSCGNGKEALEWLKLCEPDQPDIMITDIEMPLMDGFELVRSVRQLYPQIKIIFSSMYNEFEYAKSALYLGSYGYLLKPIDAGELLLCIRSVTDKIDSDLKARKDYEQLYGQLVEQRPYLIENLITGLMYGTISDADFVSEQLELLELAPELSGSRVVASLIEIDGFAQLTREMSIQAKHLFRMKVLNRVRTLLGTGRHYTAISLNDAHIGVVFFICGVTMPEEGQRQVHRLLNGILLDFAKSDISLSITVSGYSNDLLSIKFLYEQCLYILRYKYLLGGGKVMHTSDIPISREKPRWDYNAIEKELQILLNTGSPDEMTAYVNNLAARLTGNGSPKELRGFFYFLMICLQNVVHANPEAFAGRHSLTSPAAWEDLLALETVSDAVEWIKDRLLLANQCLRDREGHKNRALVSKIKIYVEQHYRSNVTLESLSESLYYSPNYLNHIFKQETGRTILDYVTRFKMEKAKEMLADDRYKLYEIAEQLGYQHTAYFSSLFKKYMGFTPKDFRRQLEL